MYMFYKWCKLVCVVDTMYIFFNFRAYDKLCIWVHVFSYVDWSIIEDPMIFCMKFMNNMYSVYIKLILNFQCTSDRILSFQKIEMVIFSISHFIINYNICKTLLIPPSTMYSVCKIFILNFQYINCWQGRILSFQKIEMVIFSISHFIINYNIGRLVWPPFHFQSMLV
jgi:hypothetical protein